MPYNYSSILFNVVVDVLPNSADIAFASVNKHGSTGELNDFVLGNCGYDSTYLQSADLKKGYALIKKEGSIPIILIVTIGDSSSKSLLAKNINKSFKEFGNLLSNKKIWIPLMGTGSGNISYIDSFKITFDTIKSTIKSIKNSRFLLSLPDAKIAGELISQFKNIENLEEIPEGKINNNAEIENTKQTNINEFINFFQKNDINIYLAGHLWQGEDQMERFISDNVWENGHDTNNDTNSVNAVKTGDIVLLKSTFAKNGSSYLRIKVIGQVFNNLKDGHNLTINWENILKEPIDIEGLGKYRRTFARLMPKDYNIVLEHIWDQSSIQKYSSFFEQNSNIIESPTRIAGLISDVDSGVDYLGISKDVNAFAKVISAKSFNPPLAIALLGKWGSGKSFFMRKLKERIQVLSQNTSTQNIYCNGIAHVHFNAWSYMDSNLWAGIITKIFEGLHEYISNDSLASKNIKAIENALTKKLNITQNELIDLKNQQQSIEKTLQKLYSKKNSSQIQLTRKIEEIKKMSMKTVINSLDENFKINTKVAEALKDNDSFNNSVEKFSKIVPRDYWQNPTELYKRTKSNYTFLKTFFIGKNWKKSLAWFCIILIFVIFMKAIVLLVSRQLPITNFTFSREFWSVITVVGAFSLRTYKTAKHLQPLISSFWKIKEDYELEKKNTLFKFKKQEIAWKLEIENHQTEITSINEQINQAKEFKSEIEYRLENTLTTEALYKFIEKRSVSDDYQKHLGIVSVIRKDFEILSELFVAHNLEAEKQIESEKFKKRFASPLQRIILYIDDLDRCSEERVVQVLEAVNLLMAYPLFIVVVGVDPRWVKNALIKKHQNQFKGNEQDSDSLEIIKPGNYLEKIFQIPFNLKASTDTSVKHMLKNLAESQPDLENNETTNLENVEESSLFDSHILPNGSTKLIDSKKQNITNETLIDTNEIIESLKFTKREIELIQEMSEILGKSPRTLKRFVNIYRIIKAHEDFSNSEVEKDGEILSVLFLIALPIGKYRKINQAFSAYLEEYDDENFSLKHFMSSDKYHLINGSIPIDYNLLRITLYNKLSEQNSDLLQLSQNVFTKNSKLIKRFTFNLK